jgi:hypothetical protein
MRRRFALAMALAALCSTACAACGTILGIEPLDAGALEDGGADGSDATPGRDSTTAADSTSPLDSTSDHTGDSGGDATLGDGAGDGGDATNQDAPDTSAGDASSADTSSADTSSPDTSSSGGGDAGEEQFVPDTGTVVVVPNAGVTIQWPTGNSQQVHVIAPAKDGRLWYFYVSDDQSSIQTSVSSDGVTWAPWDTIQLPSVTSFGGAGSGSTGFGSNFDVTCANLDGNDVVHLVASVNTTTVLHLRMTLSDQHLQTASMNVSTLVTGGGGCAVDGPGTAVLDGGRVVDVTGWYIHSQPTTECDMDLYPATPLDVGGATWNGFFAQQGYYVTVPGETGGHQLVPLASGEAISAYANGNAGYFVRVSYAKTSNGVWPDAGPQDIFPYPDSGDPSFGEGYNEWALCRLSDSDIHALRHIQYGYVFQHAVSDGGDVWVADASAPVSMYSPFNDGLVLVSDADPSHGMLAAIIGDDNVTIYYSLWSAGTGLWSAWQVLPTDPSQKSWIAGSGCGSASPMLFWTEPGAAADGGVETILGASVLPLLLAN